MTRTFLLGVTATVVGCACTPETPAAAPPPAMEAARTAPPMSACDKPSPPPTSALADVLMLVNAEWAGAPAGPIAVMKRGELVVGNAHASVQIPESEGVFFDKQAALEVVSLHHHRYDRAILVSLPESHGEDPPSRYQLYVSDGPGTLRRVMNIAPGVYGKTPIAFPGDGTVTYVESGWEACERAKHTPVAAIERVVIGDDGSGGFAVTHRVATGKTQKCTELAACPYVYVDGQQVGEILRNVRGEEAYTQQELALPAVSGPLRVQLKEEKAEITYLDAIAIVVDGERIRPRICAQSPAPNYCEVDRVSTRLAEGDVLDLWFDAPASESVALSAHGYYVPTPTLSLP